ncbi:related to 26S proteasome subunit YTA7 [Cephalotrichum gorgonifer]|uniref:Related to 26S proteasome subunit YTA7 n=1 Tax=Cephalotrichum gorgonifer TaxID=2041049 RepID=A0AAE8MUV2_9PEZI|nr:related to 26S proteasome subunit YTA7 [Cephalotrichum gorgonifer]
MASKRKRGIEDFDPNQSDPEDVDFNPDDGGSRPTGKRSRQKNNRRGPAATRRKSRYAGSDIDDDDELSDSQSEVSLDDEHDDSEDEDEEVVNPSGRRGRKATRKQISYAESSADDDDDDDDDNDEDSSKSPAKKGRDSKIIRLKVPQKGRQATQAALGTRRSTRARTEEAPEEFVELSNSGNHAVPTRGSRSVSPETAARATRTSRAMKGLKRPPDPIPEATQEEDSNHGEAESAQAQGDDGPDSQPEAVDETKVDSAGTAEAGDGEKVDGGDPPAVDADADAEGDDDDDGPVTRTRSSRRKHSAAAETEAPDADAEATPKPRRLTRRQKSAQEPSSDFEPGDESEAEESAAELAAGNDDDGDGEYGSPTPRSRRTGHNRRRSTRTTEPADGSADEVELDQDELAEELDELREDSRSRRRRRSPAIIYQEPKRRRATAKPVSYFMPPLTAANIEEDEPEDPAPTPARRRGARGGAGQGWERPLNTAYGPFGGGGGGSLLNGPWGTGATGGVDSDSSDDEMVTRSNVAGNVGMTPTSAAPAGLMGAGGGLANADGHGGVGATPNVGKVKNQKALADADPLGVDLSVNFDQVGGMQGHIDKLKEMVQLPLLYPELFMKFHVTPPRGVLFHGPPGTGKTLLARALANSVSSNGKKISFYMRKGADALSKWVGEAEKQLRLLFEEARRTQPSIIFFDEIDGLAPVRSSKQEQIHASIVSTLLALMDGMDGRGQVIVIGATNRPDNIDPALRRPGRFDREFYFPLPDQDARRAIIDIHTKDWGLADGFKNSLANRTKGYGGADIRALCTEAALNSIQRAYPQIYSSKEKLVVNPDNIAVHATDFMLSIKSMVPSSERSTTSGAAPLPAGIEPLLRDQFASIKEAVDELMPRKKKTTALEEAMYEQFDDNDHGFGREALHQEFDRCRVFRPRFLVHGTAGMGQAYIASALLHHLEGVHVQTFDLPSLLGDGRPMEQVIVGQFTEIKRHKPSVVYIPNIETWHATLRDTVAMITFQTMLKAISPTDPVLLLATSEHEARDLHPDLLKDLFGYSRKNRKGIDRPEQSNRREYFSNMIDFVKMSPAEFPDPANRKKRVLEELPVAPPPPPKVQSKAEIKAVEKKDRQLLNILKVQLQPIMDQINRKYKKFRQPAVPFSQLAHLYAEADPNHVRPDVAEGETRPYEIVQDKYGNDVLRETSSGKIFYNLETTTIEERLSNGFYTRPKDFLFDIKTLAKDSRNIGDKERTLKANELVSNVEVDVANVEHSTSAVDWESLYQRQLHRAKAAAEKERKRKALQSLVDAVQSDITANDSDSPGQGPVTIGEQVPGSHLTAARFQVMSPRSNGHGLDSAHNSVPNGTPTRTRGGDVVMGGTDDDTQPFTDVPQMQPPPVSARRSGAESASGAVATTQVSQRSAVTSMPQGVSPSGIINDASTTKTSDPSSKSSNFNTQGTNGYHDYSGLGENENSQMPDTLPLSQAQSSGEPWLHSQAHAMASGLMPGNPALTDSSPSSLEGQRGAFTSRLMSASSKSNALSSSKHLAEPSGDESSLSVRNSGASSQQPTLVPHDGLVNSFLDDITERTSGCTIEQLEQINRELMEEIWRTRGEWNRMKVLKNLTNVFNDTITDIENTQGLLQASQDEDDR